MHTLITDNLDTWTSAIKSGSSRGRGSNKKQSLYGIKKLRELILELAVRGLLVPQDAGDEPASVLLERIAAEKERLVKEKKIKKPKKLPEIEEKEQPFELPEGWEWLRLNDIGHDWGQKTPSEKFTYIDVGAINKELGIVSEANILESEAAPSRARKIVRKGTVIYSTVRPYLLNIAVIGEEFSPEPIASTAFAIVHPFLGISGRYIYRFLRSPVFVEYVESCQTGIAYPAINDKQFFSGVISVPPEAEQHRIVAKVDELMALCDQLEQQQENSIDAHQTLVGSLLGALTNAADKGEFNSAWQRIAQHFDTLFTTEHSIDQLKQTILQLAVMGKLVPQDPNDEPASELMKRITAEKEQLIKDKKIKKQKVLPLVGDEEKPFELPEGWGLCRIQGLVTLLGDGLHGTPEYDERGNYYFINGNNLNDGVIEIKSDTKKVSKEQFVRYKKQLNDRTVLVSINGTLGKIAFYNNEPIMLGKSACYFNLGEGVSKEYVKRIIEAPMFTAFAHRNATGSTIKNLGLKTINSMPVALPPLNEQHRIVKKVNELMTLCDQLKTQITKAQTTQLHLADALAEQAVS